MLRTPTRLAVISCLAMFGCSRPAPDSGGPEPAGTTSLALESPGANAAEDVVALDDDEPESATEPGTVAQLGERGVAEALNAIAQGRVQTLYIGELAPMNYLDPSTGLPGGSMGCESDAETEAYVREYNAVVTRWWNEEGPFNDGEFITFRRRGAGENLLVQVGQSEVLVAHGAGIPQSVDSGFDERLSIAAWVTTAEEPGPEEEGLSTPIDSIEWRGWTARWPLGESAPVDARAVRLFEEFAGRPH